MIWRWCGAEEAGIATAPHITGAHSRPLSPYTRLLHLENLIHHQLVKHSVAGLRITLGLVFLGFGVLKYFPGVSPAQNLTEATTHALFLGLVPGAVAIKLIATLECFIGVCLLANRWMRLAIWLLAIEFVGILSPVVLLPARLFAGPHHAPTLEGQYCLKDIILVAAGLVVAAGSFRGGRMIRTDLEPGIRYRPETVDDPQHRLRIVLDGLNDADGGRARCLEHDITEAEFHRWRDTALTAARDALTEPQPEHPRHQPPSRPAARLAGRALSFVVILGALRRR